MDAHARIAVAGATGRVGHHVVDVLQERGYDVVPMSRATGVDVVTGAGLAEALTGVDAIVDAATGPSPEQEAATRFFTASARNLQTAGARAGVGRLVAVSIIGADRFAGGYGAAKIAHEQTTLAGPIPARVVRASQFHEFVAELVGWGRQGDVSYLPEMRTQLVAARTAAEALAGLVTGPDSEFAPGTTGVIPEIAGPREENLVAAARQLVARRGEALRIEAGSNPSDPDSEVYTSGALLPGAGATLAGPTFAEWLEAGVPAGSSR
jgi:uncharacterized protein YbjT (DUF2867 family)